MNSTMRALALFLLISLCPTLTWADLSIITVEEPPTNFMQDEAIVGIVVDIVKEIQKATGDTTPIKLLPGARAVSQLLERPNTVLFTVGKNPTRVDKGVIFIGPVVTRKHVLIQLKRSQVSIHCLEDINAHNYSVGGLRGDWRVSYMEGHGVTVKTTRNHSENMFKLREQRIDLWLSSDIEAPVIAMKNGWSMEDFKIAHILMRAPSFIAFSPGSDPDTVQKWRQAFASLKKTDFFKTTAQKWGEIFRTSIWYSPETGFVFGRMR